MWVKFSLRWGRFLKLLKLNSGYEVIVLESSSEIGGISRTVKYHGNRMDIGGHRFFSKDPRVKAIWNELMPQQGSITICVVYP